MTVHNTTDKKSKCLAFLTPPVTRDEAAQPRGAVQLLPRGTQGGDMPSRSADRQCHQTWWR